MGERRRDDHLAVVLKVLDDDLVGVLQAHRCVSARSASSRESEERERAHLDVEALEVGHLVRVDALLVDRARRHLLARDDAVGDGDAVVVVTERRRLVDDARAGRVGHVRVRDDAERTALELRAGSTRQGLERMQREEEDEEEERRTFSLK